MNNTYPLGSLVRSIEGECDIGDGNIERVTGPNAWGWIDDQSLKSGYYVCFGNGTSVFITQEELDDRKFYDVCTPEAMAGRLKEIRALLTVWRDDEIVPQLNEYDDALQIIGA